MRLGLARSLVPRGGHMFHGDPGLYCRCGPSRFLAPCKGWGHWGGLTPFGGLCLPTGFFPRAASLWRKGRISKSWRHTLSGWEEWPGLAGRYISMGSFILHSHWCPSEAQQEAIEQTHFRGLGFPRRNLICLLLSSLQLILKVWKSGATSWETPPGRKALRDSNLWFWCQLSEVLSPGRCVSSSKCACVVFFIHIYARLYSFTCLELHS